MENIERTQFVVLTGHLDDQPLPDLVRRLRVQRKSGRLQVEYPDAPGSFFFEDGQLVDAQLGSLRGVEAVYAALALDGASFNFNPLVKAPERSIDRQGQGFIRDLVEGPRREGLAEIKIAGREFDAVGAAGGSAIPSLPRQSAPLQLPPAAAEVLAPLEVRLTAVEEAIVSTSNRFSRERMVYAVIIGFLTGLCLVATVNIFFDPFRPNAPAPATTQAAGVATTTTTTSTQGLNPSNAATAGEAARTTAASENSTPKAESATADAEPPVPASAAVIGTRRLGGLPAPRGEYVVQVLVEVKGGRVTDARVWNPRPGAGAYESVALKMARERRYPENFTGGERLKLRVRP